LVGVNVTVAAFAEWLQPNYSPFFKSLLRLMLDFNLPVGGGYVAVYIGVLFLPRETRKALRIFGILVMRHC
jgi:hypothetical protein